MMISQIKHNGIASSSYPFSTIIFFRVSTKRNNNSYVNYLLRVSGSIETFLKPCNFFVVVARTRSAKWTLAKGDR